jgi:hypothetical protein
MSYSFRPYYGSEGGRRFDAYNHSYNSPSGYRSYSKNFKNKKMSYGNYNNDFSYGRSRYGASPSYNGKRRSSCKVITKNGVSYVTGWKIGRKAGFRTFFVSPAKNQKRIYSKKDGSATPWMTAKCEVVNKTQATKSLFPAMIHEKSLKVFILSLGIMINPNTGFISYIPKKK